MQSRPPARLPDAEGTAPAMLAGELPPVAPRPTRPWWRSRMARFSIGAIVAKALHAALDAVLGPAAWLDVLDILVAAALVVAAAWLLYRLFVRAKRRLLWRVRRKLVLSYVFIGFVPVLLIVAFFLFAGLLMFFHVSAFLFKRGIDDVVDSAVVIAQTTASELRRSPAAAADDVLNRKVTSSRQVFPGASIALVPRGKPARAIAAKAHGPWDHMPAPVDLPGWVSREGFSGLMAYSPSGEPRETGLVIRAVAFPEQREPEWGVIVDLPVTERVLAELRAATGIELQGVDVVPPGGGQQDTVESTRRSVPLVSRPAAGAPGWALNSVTILDYAEWESGRRGTLTLSIRVNIHEIYNRLTAAQSRLGNLSLGDLFMAALGVLAVLFLIIEAVALVMGFALARSITGSIHALFQGTERVKRQDFAHRITVTSNDQLGELASSFNEMTSSIQNLLRERDERRRLEEELRIAREIQMSLLPRGALRLPGLAITALCVPAREVGGDYYDFFRLDAHKVGVLIADVAGKGTSAALYMAELKGLMLSLSAVHHSPKKLLVEVNRILSDHLDTRSFITMTYAVLDLAARTMTWARAGHTPLIHFTGDGRSKDARALAPEGLVVGLRIEGIARKFEQLLVEQTIELREGDVLVLYTDGITEAMNPDTDLFGDSRLLAIVEEHGHDSTEVLRERILREIEVFVGAADQHDDMTMILIKVEGLEKAAVESRAEAGALSGLSAVPASALWHTPDGV